MSPPTDVPYTGGLAKAHANQMIERPGGLDVV
jgi:hypothetical protein